MGRTRWSYDYPEVHPPQSQVQHRVETQQTNNQIDDRYSWVDQPGEEQHRHATQPIVPQLPMVPEHTEQKPQRQQQLLQAQQRVHSPLQHQHHHTDISKQQEAAMYQHSNQLAQHTQQVSTQQWQQQQLQLQQQQEQLQHLQASYQSTDYPQKPESVKVSPDPPTYRGPVSPDVNPLSPGASPKFLHPNRQPTNMSTTSPATSDYTFTSYQSGSRHTNGGHWHNDLCSCSEPTICMTGLFCPCILYARVQHRLNLRTERRDPTNLLGYNSVNGSCVAWSLLCGINGILSGLQKTRVRRAYSMENGSGNVFSDCLVGCCCCCCVLAQNEKEIKSREEHGRKLVAQEGYVSPSGMTFAPPPR